jgi:hypothetical protein
VGVIQLVSGMEKVKNVKVLVLFFVLYLSFVVAPEKSSSSRSYYLLAIIVASVIGVVGLLLFIVGMLCNRNKSDYYNEISYK